MPDDSESQQRPVKFDLLAAFRAQYHHFSNPIQSALVNECEMDPTILERWGNDVEEYRSMVTQVCLKMYGGSKIILSTLYHQHAGVFETQEYLTLSENIVLMLSNI
jgi:hypothetical protein